MLSLSALTLLLVALKLLGVIAWSWWLVISPLYVLVFFFGILIFGVSNLGQRIQYKRPW
jgi:hypothetical protein